MMIPGGFQGGGSTGGSFGTDTVPAMLTPGEHVLPVEDVKAMGGQSGVYAFRDALHGGAGRVGMGKVVGPPASLEPGVAPSTNIPGGTGIGGLAAPTGTGPGFTITGGGLIGVLESLPSTAINAAITAAMAAAAARRGGAVIRRQGGGKIGSAIPGGTPIGGLAPPTGTGSGFGIGGGLLGLLESLPSTAIQYGISAGTAQAIKAGAAAAAARRGGAVRRFQTGGATGGAMSSAGGTGGDIAGSLISAVINIGMQELNRAISFAGQAVGIGVSGLMETLLPAGASEIAQNSWLSKIVGGIVGARPAIPNLAGQSATSLMGQPPALGNAITPEQLGQLTPGQVLAAAPPMPQPGEHGGTGAPPGPVISSGQPGQTAGQFTGLGPNLQPQFSSGQTPGPLTPNQVQAQGFRRGGAVGQPINVTYNNIGAPEDRAAFDLSTSLDRMHHNAAILGR